MLAIKTRSINKTNSLDHCSEKLVKLFIFILFIYKNFLSSLIYFVIILNVYFFIFTLTCLFKKKKKFNFHDTTLVSWGVWSEHWKTIEFNSKAPHNQVQHRCRPHFIVRCAIGSKLFNEMKIFWVHYNIFNRPGVAGAVLQSPLKLRYSLINSVSHPFPPSLQNIITLKQYFLESLSPHHLSNVRCRVSLIFTFYLIYFFISDKVVELVGGGSFINGAYPP